MPKRRVFSFGANNMNGLPCTIVSHLGCPAVCTELQVRDSLQLLCGMTIGMAIAIHHNVLCHLALPQQHVVLPFWLVLACRGKSAGQSPQTHVILHRSCHEGLAE